MSAIAGILRKIGALSYKFHMEMYTSMYTGMKDEIKTLRRRSTIG